MRIEALDEKVGICMENCNVKTFCVSLTDGLRFVSDFKFEYRNNLIAVSGRI